MDISQPELHGRSTSYLMRHALEEARLLATAELLHAKEELREEMRAAKVAGVLLGVAFTLALNGLSVLFVALALALSPPSLQGLLAVGVGLLALAGTSAWLGYKKLPKQPLGRTQRRLKLDFVLAKGQLA